jgi:hypothetical protein
MEVSDTCSNQASGSSFIPAPVSSVLNHNIHFELTSLLIHSGTMDIGNSFVQIIDGTDSPTKENR